MAHIFGICFTFNNPTAETFVKAHGAVGQAGIKYICWGNEVGEQGTPHMQGYIQSNQDKYARLMKVIGTCHMEKMKGDSKQAVDVPKVCLYYLLIALPFLNHALNLIMVNSLTLASLRRVNVNVGSKLLKNKLLTPAGLEDSTGYNEFY
jgi:hypothetical protein